MTTALPLNPINTINATNINATTIPTPPHKTTDPINTHESDPPLDYVHSLMDMTVHTIDSIWPVVALTDETKKVVDTRTFIKHILRHSRTRHSTLLISVFYLYRIKPRLIQAQKTVASDERRYLMCGRRMFLVALALAWKYQEDRSPSSKFWSKVSGLPVAQITLAERLFLGLLDYQLHIPKDSYDQWTVLVQRHCGLPDTPPANRLHSPPPEQHLGGDFKRRRYATPRSSSALSPLPTPPADTTFGDSPLKRKWS